MIDDPAAVCRGAALRTLIRELQEHFVGASALAEVAREELENYLADATDGVRIGGSSYTTDVLATTEAGDQKARDAISRSFDAMGELDGHANGTRRLPEVEVKRLRGVLAEARIPGWLTQVSIKSQEDILDSTATTATIKFCSIARFTRGEHVSDRRTPASARAVAERLFAGLNHSWRLERSMLEQSHSEKERARVADELRVVFFRLLNDQSRWRFDIYEWDLGAEVDVRAYDWAWSKTEGASRVVGSQKGQPVWIIDLKSNRLMLRISFADPHVSTPTVAEPHSFLARLSNAQAFVDTDRYERALLNASHGPDLDEYGRAVTGASYWVNQALEDLPPDEALLEIKRIEQECALDLSGIQLALREQTMLAHERFLSERYDEYRDDRALTVDREAMATPHWERILDSIDRFYFTSVDELQQLCAEARESLAG